MSEIGLQTSVTQVSVDIPDMVAASAPQAGESKPSGQGSSDQKPQSVPDIQALVEKANSFVRSRGTEITFEVNILKGESTIIVRNRETGKFIRQIPPEEMKIFAEKMGELLGIIFQKTV